MLMNRIICIDLNTSTGMFPSAGAPIAKSSAPSVVHHRPE
jgi:hypothetical protein